MRDVQWEITAFRKENTALQLAIHQLQVNALKAKSSATWDQLLDVGMATIVLRKENTALHLVILQHQQSVLRESLPVMVVPMLDAGMETPAYLRALSVPRHATHLHRHNVLLEK